MTQQHDAPEGGAEAAMLDAMGEVIASMMKRDALDHYRRERVMFEAGPVNREEEGYTGHYEGCLAEAESYVERLRRRGYDVVPCSPTPPAPSGLVDAVRAYREAEQGFDEGRVSPHQLAQARSTLDATLSGQQSGAVPAGDLQQSRVTYASLVKPRRASQDTPYRIVLTRKGSLSPAHYDISREQALLLIADMQEAGLFFDCARLAEQPAPAGTGDDPDKAYKLGKEDGYAAAVADIDRVTEGDGEYVHSMGGPSEAHCPDPGAMIARIQRRFAALAAPAGTGDADRVEGLRVKLLDWQETYTDRGDGTHEVTGWEAATGFGEWYSVESFMSSDSYGYQALLGHEVIKHADDPDTAKEYAQADFERRVRAALDGASGQEEG